VVKRRCVFLDRDGVINVAPPPGEYILSAEDLHIIPSIADWIRLFNVLGLLTIVITNQRCVARGLLRREELERIHEKMRQELAHLEAHVDDIFYCPHEEGTCTCRKPGAGLVEQACKKWNIDLEGSIVIGDSEPDRLLAQRCGMAFVHVHEGRILDVIKALKS
jgi:histidinol-phosphate phosphatase family protein